MIEHDGYRVGLVGLIEEDWLAACATVDVGNLQCARPMTPPASFSPPDIPRKCRGQDPTRFNCRLSPSPRNRSSSERAKKKYLLFERQHSLPHASS